MKKFTFTARIESSPGGRGAYVLFPYDVEKEFGTKGRVAVKVTFDGLPYTGSLMKYGQPRHMIGVLKALQEQLGKKFGDKVKVEVWKDEEVRIVQIPADFAALLKKEKLLPVFEKLSYSHRKEYVRWITESKKEETRTNRLAKSLVMLRKGTETPG
jgi:hypothetical protein